MNSAGAKTWEQYQKERKRNLRGGRNSNITGATSSRKKSLIVLLAALIAIVLIGALSFLWYFREVPLEVSGATIYVKSGGNFQTALDRAKSGDTILLQAGATFSGPFYLPNKTGSEFITIRSSVPDSQLPPGDTRIDPKKYASVFPKLISPVAEPVITAKESAHHYRFIAVEFGGTKDGVGNIVKLGTTEEKSIAELPHHIEFDRIYMHGTSPLGQRRGIAANGRFIKVINSYISDIKRKGDESQSIAAWATDGPIEIINNYLEAAAENVLFGGGGSTLRLVPTDCLVKDNFINKPIKWREEGWQVKNLFEIKFGKRIRVTNNLMTGNWGMAQDGTAILFSTREDIGKETIIDEIYFENNIVRGSGNGISVFGAEGSGGHRLYIRNNIFDDINGQKWGSSGFFMKSTAWDGLVIENNTIIQTGNIANAYDDPSRSFVFRNNIVFENEYGFKGDNVGSGNPTIAKFFTSADVNYNAIIGGDSSLYRGTNFFPTSIDELRFVNYSGMDFRLKPESKYRGRGFGGKNIGADLDPKSVGGR